MQEDEPELNCQIHVLPHGICSVIHEWSCSGEHMYHLNDAEKEKAHPKTPQPSPKKDRSNIN